MTERDEGTRRARPPGHEAGADPARLIALMCAEARRLTADDGLVSRVVLRVGDAHLEMERSGAADGAADGGGADEPDAPDHDADHVTSPVVGTFYRAPEPGAAPFVEVGQAVEEDTVVGIVEAMKLMNKITANRRGIVTTVLVPDATPVEYGQPLLAIAPALPAA
jgi:acetyl-CoA carboxylase biotin carboxyl carrier protein